MKVRTKASGSLRGSNGLTSGNLWLLSGYDGVILFMRAFGYQGWAFMLRGWDRVFEQRRRVNSYLRLMATGKLNVALR